MTASFSPKLNFEVPTDGLYSVAVMAGARVTLRLCRHDVVSLENDRIVVNGIDIALIEDTILETLAALKETPT
jgi:hypothetical protein